MEWYVDIVKVEQDGSSKLVDMKVGKTHGPFAEEYQAKRRMWSIGHNLDHDRYSVEIKEEEV